MTDTTLSPTSDTPDSLAGDPGGKPKEEGNFFVFLLKLAVLVLVFRSFIFAPFSIPSESMLPRLLKGDQLLASKWAYGLSNHSLPFGISPFPDGRLFASEPERGDVVIFKAPPLNDEDYIKRVIGVPGDQVQMIDGVIHLNGKAVPKLRIADFEVPQSPNTDCASAQFAAARADGTRVCRYPQFRETLPNGVTYDVLDFGNRPQDNTAATIVPEGMLFLMGDNRDNSQDSRFPATPGGGVGLVPQDNLVGEATVMMWSSDGSAELLKPWTWLTTVRWNRIGGSF